MSVLSMLYPMKMLSISFTIGRIPTGSRLLPRLPDHATAIFSGHESSSSCQRSPNRAARYFSLKFLSSSSSRSASTTEAARAVAAALITYTPSVLASFFLFSPIGLIRVSAIALYSMLYVFVGSDINDVYICFKPSLDFISLLRCKTVSTTCVLSIISEKRSPDIL